MKTIITTIKANYKLVLSVLAIGLVLGWIIAPSGGEPVATEDHSGHDHAAEEATVWTCSMHPQIKQDKPGLCPICAMDLIPLQSMSSGSDITDPNEIVLSESAAKLADIQTTIVAAGQPEKALYLQGKLHMDERRISELTARFGGRIEQLYVNFTGQEVRKGQKLASVYSPELVSAQRELIEAAAFKADNPALYTAARAKLLAWDISEEQIAGIEKTSEPSVNFDVLSPITGTVMMRHVALGDYVKTGAPLFKLADLSALWAMFDAYESDLPWISTGDVVKFTVQALPGETFAAKVSYIDPYIDGKTRVAKVRADISNNKGRLKPEMFTTGLVQTKVSIKSGEVVVPKSAVLWTGKRAVVYTKVQDREAPTFLYREVVLGPQAGGFYVVKEGLQEGEEVATNGVFKIDAAAQLVGLPSMMNPQGGAAPTGHNHGDMGGQSSTNHAGHQQSNQGQHAMFTVAGNCEMCKDRIETAASGVNGVTQATWDVDKKEMHVNFNAPASIDAIQKAIAKAGHDTEKFKADDAVYKDLPGCCQYERMK